MVCLEEFGLVQLIEGLNINGSLHFFLSRVRGWRPVTSSTHRDAAAELAKARAATVFRMEGLPEYWWCTEQKFTVLVRTDAASSMIVAEARRVLIHKCSGLEGAFAEEETLRDPESITNP